jgi:urease accessory protein
LGEEWVFSHYYSVNEILHDTKRVAKDAMLLDNEKLEGLLPNRSLQERLQPYSCYATLILFGPSLQSIIADISTRYDKISVFKANNPAQLIWSLSSIGSANQGVVVRVAGIETETVKGWLRESLHGLEPIVGIDVYRRTFP